MIPAPTAFVNNVALPEFIIILLPVYHQPSRVTGRDILSNVNLDVNSILFSLRSDLPSWVILDMLNYFQGFFAGDVVVRFLGLNNTELAL